MAFDSGEAPGRLRMPWWMVDGRDMVDAVQESHWLAFPPVDITSSECHRERYAYLGRSIAPVVTPAPDRCV